MFNNYSGEWINEGRKSTNRIYPDVIKVSKPKKKLYKNKNFTVSYNTCTIGSILL